MLIVDASRPPPLRKTQRQCGGLARRRRSRSRGTRSAGGAGDPAGERLDDCATQRNLTDMGRREARRLGDKFRAERVARRKVLSRNGAAAARPQR